MIEKLSIQKRLILEAALKLMLEGAYEHASIDNVSSYTRLDPEKIRQHYATDENLRMSAMKYAAVVWVEQVKADLKKQQTKKDTLYALIRHFIAGSESHPQSLSLYVDIWKKLRDLKTENRQLLSDELSEIYRYYVSFFREAMEDIYGNEAGYDMEQLAWIMVVISDGFHVQSLIQPQQLDFDGIAHTFCKILEQ
jgi:AcrR family transcriptional regulator